MALNLPLPQSRVPNYAKEPEALFPLPKSTEPEPLNINQAGPSYVNAAGEDIPLPKPPLVKNPFAIDDTPAPSLGSQPTATQAGATVPIEPTVMNVTPPAESATGPLEASTGPGLLPVSEQRTGSMYAPGTEDALNEAVEGQKKAMENIKAINMRLDNETKPLFASLVARSEDLASFLDPNSDGYKAFVRKTEDVKNKMEAAHADLEEFQKTAAVDPAKYYKETPFIQHAVNVIAMLMEAKTAGAMIRAGLPAPTGMVMARIDKAINDDIARQRDAIRSKEAGMTNEINRYRDNLKLLGDERAAEYKTRAEMLHQIGTTINATKARYDNEFNTANLDKAAADVEANRVKALAEMGKTIMQQGFAAPVGKSISDEQLTRKQEKMVNVLGSEVEARTPEDAKVLKEKSVATETVLANLSELKSLREKSNLADWAKLITEKRSRANFLIGSLHMNLKNTWGMGAFDAGTKEFLKDVVPNMDALSHVLDTYETIEDTVTSSYTDELNQRTRNTYSLKSVRDLMFDRAKGKLTPRQESTTGGGSGEPAPLPPPNLMTGGGSFGFGK
jgi:hypothetical protein